MSHIIIIGAIDELQGQNITGAGTLETLKGLMATVEVCEEQRDPSSSARAVLDQAEAVAGLFTNGFTAISMAGATTVLQTAVDNYLNNEN